VSQTEGAELPDLKERVKGDVGDYRERLIDFILAQGIELEFKESIAPALGMSYGGRIAILPGQSAAEEYLAIDTIHESATNPRRIFDEAKLQEFAAFVPGNKMLIMWRTSVLTIWHNDSKSGERMCGPRIFPPSESY
jgi:hypothetical protein